MEYTNLPFFLRLPFFLCFTTSLFSPDSFISQSGFSQSFRLLSHGFSCSHTNVVSYKSEKPFPVVRAEISGTCGYHYNRHVFFAIFFCLLHCFRLGVSGASLKVHLRRWTLGVLAYVSSTASARVGQFYFSALLKFLTLREPVHRGNSEHHKTAMVANMGSWDRYISLGLALLSNKGNRVDHIEQVRPGF